MLPRYYNWQTEVRGAFAADFPRPEWSVEKWWALQTITFSARDAGTLWTPAVSCDRLDRDFEGAGGNAFRATNLPRARGPFVQAVISNFDPDRQTVVLQAKMRDLDRAHWRMAPQFVALTDAYRRVFADYLGGLNGGVPASVKGLKNPQGQRQKCSAADTIKKLDALDAQRRAIETAARPGVFANTPH